MDHFSFQHSSKKEVIMKRFFFCILFFLFGGTGVFGQEVRICDDGAEWPPYLYYQRVDGKINKKQLVGAVKELFDVIFEQAGLDYSIRLIPWKRCLLEVENFDTSGKYEIFGNGSYGPHRTEKFWPSLPLYITHRGVFYSEKKYPQGPSIRKKSDVARYRLCGVDGYDYKEVFTWGDNIRIDQGAKSNGAALKKIALDRCDLMITSMEPIYGAVAAGILKMPEGIKSFPMPGLSPSIFHFWISKKSSRALDLLASLNTAMMNAIYSRQYKKIFTKYLPESLVLYE